ncbi:MAG: hypothetical protein M0Z80_06130 [Treponema sp.]|nr:hypothetical protein [Treponema sp.]
MKPRPRIGLGSAFWLVALLASFPLSCELSPTILSTSERSSLYTINLSAAGRPVSNGSILEPGSSLAVSVTGMSDTPEPASLELSVNRPDGGAIASLQLDTASSASSPVSAQGGAASPQLVPRIEGSLPALALPAQTSPGAYKIACLVSSSDGKVLQQSNFVVFVGESMPTLSTVLAYPPSAEPGSAFLLAAMVAKAAGSDPWVAWSRGGSVFSQGPLSAGTDRVVWVAPLAEGAYALSVDVYPCAPPDASGFSFSSAAHQDIKAMVRMPSGGTTDEFADPLRFYSLLRLSGNFDDLGTRPRTAQPAALGLPRLDVYSGGFGYRFGPAAGVSIPGLLPPVDGGGSMLPLVALFRLSPDGGDGRLVRFASDDGSFALNLGLQGGRPYVEVVSGGQGPRSVAESAIRPGPVVLAALLTPAEGRVGIVWIADGERISAPSLPLPSVPHSGGATLGGPGSLPGVYGGFGLVTKGPPPPLYRLEERRRWKSDLILAEGFETGALPPGFTSSGPVSFTVQGLALGPGASLEMAQELRLDRGRLVEAAYGGASSAALVDIVGAGGERLATVAGSGELTDGKGRRFGNLRFAPGLVRFSLSEEDGALLFASEDGAPALRLAGAAEARVTLDVRNGSSPAAIRLAHVLVRSAGASPAQ